METKTKLMVEAAGLFAVLIVFMVFGCVEAPESSEEFSFIPDDAIVAGSGDVQYLLVKTEEMLKMLNKTEDMSMKYYEILDVMEKEAGINPKDISRMEFYMSDTDGKKAGLVLYGKINKNKLLGTMGSYKKGTYKNVTTYTQDVSYSNPGMVAFIDENTFIAGTTTGVKSMIDVKTGSRSNFLSNSKNSEMNKKLGKGNIKIIASVEEDLLNEAGLDRMGVDFKNIDSIGYRDGSNGMLAIAECTDEDSADDLKNSLSKQIAALKGQIEADGDEVPEEDEEIYGYIKDVVESIKVERSGRDVKITGNEFEGGTVLFFLQQTGFQRASATGYSQEQTINSYSGFGQVRPVNWTYNCYTGGLDMFIINTKGQEISGVACTADVDPYTPDNPEPGALSIYPGGMGTLSCTTSNTEPGSPSYHLQVKIYYVGNITGVPLIDKGELQGMCY